MNDVITVACAVEGEDYVRHCATMLHSLLARHEPGRIHIHYLHGPESSARSRRKLAEMVKRQGGEIAFHAVPDEWVAEVPVKGFTGKATWYRSFLPAILPRLPRILYLDADLLVVDSLEPLFAIDLDGHLVAAVSNVPMKNDRGHWRAVGLPREGAYFNAGVLLMNLELMRNERTTEQVIRWGAEHGDSFGLRDQDALNAVLHERRLALEPRWNCMNSVIHFPWSAEILGAEKVEEARHTPAIRHFEGPEHAKPWHLLSPEDVRRLYVTHRRQTPWPRMRPTGCTPQNLIRYVRRRATRM
jgi:lipopolysaccharide biosynthesis glycosyltransferase